MRYRKRIGFRRVAIAVALVQLAVLVGVALYLAISGRRLVIAFATPEVVEPGATAEMIVPVAGVRRAELRDSYAAARSGGREHRAIDIPAAEGTPVLAAADGVIVKRDSSALGGISLYQRSPDGTTIYFYAHLQRYQPGVVEGNLVRRGEVIGYVGHTGNAQPTNPHLHFGVWTVTDPNRWWHGRNLNPYTLLTEDER